MHCGLSPQATCRESYLTGISDEPNSSRNGPIDQWKIACFASRRSGVQIPFGPLKLLAGLQKVQFLVFLASGHADFAQLLRMAESADIVYFSEDEKSAVEPDARNCRDELSIGSSGELLSQLDVDLLDLCLHTLETVQARGDSWDVQRAHPARAFLREWRPHVFGTRSPR
jgi:hypothetical protein